MNKQKLKIKDMCYIAMFTALTAVMAQVVIPMPNGVPITLQTFAVCLAGAILGSKKGALSALIYVALGAVGAPVFSGLGGGFGVVFGPTGGFILSFPVMAFIIGLSVEKGRSKFALVIGLVAGMIVTWICGLTMFVFLTGRDLQFAVMACVVPFIPGDIAKAIIVWLVGPRIRARLLK